MSEDQIITCVDCKQSFTWSASEQEFFREKGFTQPPKRCKECRQAKKEQRGSAGRDKGGTMPRTRNLVLTLLTLAASAFLLPTSTRADIIQLSGPADLSPSAIVAPYPDAPGTRVDSPYALAAGDVLLTFTRSNGGFFERVDQGDGWQGTFAPGTRLLWDRRQPELDGEPFVGSPVEIFFSKPVSEVGFFFQHNIYYGDQSFSFSLYNLDDPLGTLTVNGIDTPLFFGARATDGDLITSIFIQGSSSFGFGTDFVLGEVSFVTPEQVPEPATMLLLGTGLAGIGAFVRKRRQAGKGEEA